MDLKESHLRLWKRFSECNDLSEKQLEQFKLYSLMLVEYNKNVNLTAITSVRKVIADHFQDSLALADHLDLANVRSIADVGAGAGFPAIPLKILFPHLKVLLIEVTHKKRQFLKLLIEKLGLEDVEIYELDWRTFLRTTQGEIDLFVSRAALDAVELIRLFRHTSSYRVSTMVYWVSESWEPHKKVEKYIDRIEEYHAGDKKRRLVFLKDATAQVTHPQD